MKIPSRFQPQTSTADVVVVGSGFGGLATALRLSELGARVVLCEALAYPGGCASTFTHRGYREAGATLFSVFGQGQLFRRWIDDCGRDVMDDWLDPVVEMRTPSIRFPVSRRRDALIATFAMFPEPRETPSTDSSNGSEGLPTSSGASWASPSSYLLSVGPPCGGTVMMTNPGLESRALQRRMAPFHATR